MPKEAAMTATHLDWNRELCKMGCSEWVPWYRNKKNKIANGCRLGAIPQKVNGQWYCQHRKTTKQKGDKDHAQRAAGCTEASAMSSMP